MTAQQKTYVEPVSKALAAYLASQNVVQYNPTGGYTENPNLPAVVFGTLPSTPLTAVSIRCYGEQRADDDNPDLFFQLRFRAGGSPFAVDRMADKVFPLLHWGTDHPPMIWPGGVAVLFSRRLFRTTSTETDVAGRYERPDSYRLHINPGSE